MGLSCSPDLAQSTMEAIFQDMLHEIKIYIDDIGIFDRDWQTHLDKVSKVLRCLHVNGFQVNPVHLSVSG